VSERTRASVLILTLNEEINIGDCIDSCGWADDIVVFDSYSTDKTCDIARNRGARVIQRAFDNYAAQRNAALNEVRYRHPWVLMVDADERVPPELAAEVQAAVAGAAEGTVMFRMRRKDFFFGRWLRRSSGYPTWFGRLVRLGKVRVEREFNEEFIPDGVALPLKEHLHHYPFNKGIDFWFERHNRYSGIEAGLLMKMRSEPVNVLALFNGDPTSRRRALKQIASRVPMRPWFVFLYLYVARFGFLDGRGGFYFSRMRATYEMLIDLKVVEATRRSQNSAV